MRLRDLEATFLRHVSRAPDDEARALNPKWPADYMQDAFQPVATLAEAHGITFICPKSKAADNDHHTMIWFEGSPVPPHIGKNKAGQTVRWRITSGTGLDDLCLQPSIQEEDEHCKWHGYIGGSVGQSPGDAS